MTPPHLNAQTAHETITPAVETCRTIKESKLEDVRLLLCSDVHSQVTMKPGTSQLGTLHQQLLKIHGDTSCTA
jgi:hypothetical protein